MSPIMKCGNPEEASMTQPSVKCKLIKFVLFFSFRVHHKSAPIIIIMFNCLLAT